MSLTKENCIANALRVTEYAPKIRARTLVVSWAWIREEIQVNKPDGEWDKTAEGMMLNFAEGGHPVFRATGLLERGELKSKGKGAKNSHFNGSDETIDLILRTVISVNQLTVYGAVPDLCEELTRDSAGAWKPAASGNFESMVIPTEFPTANPISQTDPDVR